MKVAELMSRDVRLASPDATLSEIAKDMAEMGLGFMPVGEQDRLIGTVTDRDIVVRGLATGMDGEATVRDVMTPDVKYCYEDEDIEHVAMNMGNIQVRRLPVMNRENRLVGIISLADVATTHGTEAAGIAMSGIAEPGGSYAT